MALVPGKCPFCGSVISIDSQNEAYICPHCGKPHVVKKAIEYFNSSYTSNNGLNRNTGRVSKDGYRSRDLGVLYKLQKCFALDRDLWLKVGVGTAALIVLVCIGLLVWNATRHVHVYSTATCTRLATCSCGETRGELGNHNWKTATCETPKTCSVCGATEGKALGHSWTSSTCTEPKTCTTCGVSEGSPKGHSWTNGSSTTPSMCRYCHEMKALALPSNGQIFKGAGASGGGTLTIKSSSSSNCFVKVKDSAGNEKVTFFVRAGMNVTVNVPAGSYYVYFAYGDDWYGTSYCFGNDTVYTKDSSICDFTNYSWEYTLYPVTDGNFKETPIKASDF